MRTSHVVVCLGLVACSGAGDETGDEPIPRECGDEVDAQTVPLAGTCALEDRYGAIVVEAHEEYSFVDGQVLDGVVPVTILEEVGSAGDCVLLRKNNPVCDPACAPEETCDFDGTCIPYPLSQDLGVVSVLGLESEVVMEPVQPGNKYFDTQVPHPPFAPDAVVTLCTGGGAFEPVELHGVGFTPLDTPAEQWILFEDEALTVTWEAAPADTRTRVALKINIDQHGNSPVNLQCDFADTGSGTVDQSLVDQLVNFGVSGFPSGSLSRRTVDSGAVGDGCMEFSVASPRAVDVRVDGFIPCDEPSDCPKGMECNMEREICE